MSVYEHALTEPTGAHDHGCFADSFADRIMERVLIDDFMTTEVGDLSRLRYLWRLLHFHSIAIAITSGFATYM